MARKFALLLCILLTLCACGKTAPTPTEAATAPTASTEAVTEAPTAEPTQPPHPTLVIPDLAVEDALRYFGEVCLDAEFIHSGNPSLLQKWDVPISYAIHGIPTEEDLETLLAFTDWLNTLEGFPGISRADDPAFANLRIHFCDRQRMLDLMGEQFYDMDGAVTFWYEENAIYDAIICIRTDLDQQLRNSVILEELYNGLGPIQDTDLRPDSIIYAGFSQPQQLTDVDRLILQLLYHPTLECGMNASQCEAAIRALYQ